MRTLFWCGCAIALTMASFVYLAADYAVHHPDSIMARCVHVGYRVSCQFTPLGMLSRVMTRRGVGAGEQASCYESATAEVVGASADCAVECEAADPAPCQIIDLTKFMLEVPQECEDRAAPELIEGREPVPPPAACDPNRSSEAEPVLVPPTIIDESSDEYQSIPSSIEDETEPPISIPPSDNPAAAGEREDPVTAEAEPIGMPKSENDEPTWWLEMLRGVSEVEMAPAAQEPPLDGAPEESEMIHDGIPPEMREDPASIHAYPGCPNIRNCDDGDPCPASTALPPAEPKKVKKQGKKRIDSRLDSLKRICPSVGAAEESECPGHPDVDTTEFRKSDANPDEFKPQPF